MTNKTEDRFYFGKPGQPEKFLRIDPRSVEQWEASARQKIDSVGPTVWIFVDPSGKEIWLPRPMRFREAVTWLVLNQKQAKPNDYYKVAHSRPGQPERFAGYGAWHPTAPFVPKPQGAHRYKKGDRVVSHEGRNPRTGVIDRPVRDMYGNPEYVVYWDNDGGTAQVADQYLTKMSRPGQPDKFDVSSLDRGSFAEASTSPMLGKLLAAKVMPEGGWRAVQSGSDTLVISFEDADLARDFGRRAATKGYNATSPVQAIGRYWNVEVKNGK